MTLRAETRRPDAGRILDSAGRVFARRGYAHTSLRQLMAAAKVSTTAFYARFASKEEVLSALVKRLLDELDERARHDLALAQGIEDGFRRGVEALVAVLAPQRELVRVALTEAAVSPEVTASLGERYAGLAALLSVQIAALARHGEVAVVDPDAIAWSLIGALHMQILRWAVYRQLDTEALVPALHAVAGSHLLALRPAAAPRQPRRRATREGERS